MSSPFPDVAPAQMPAAAPPRRTRQWPDWSREPLLHFVLIGAVLFGIDHALVTSQDDPRTIVVATEVDQQARALFKASRGREPNADELRALRERWLHNEVLYREGLSLQVDRGDTAIRERVIFKSISLINSNLKLPKFDDALLRAWFEKNRHKYDEPARYDFQEAALSGEAPEAAVRAFVLALNNGTPGDAKAGLRVFKSRPHSNVVDSYGAEFAKALEESPVGEWRAMATKEGWRAMRLDLITPAKPAQFEALRGVIQQDWTDVTMADLRTAEVNALASKYTVRVEAVKP